MIGVNPAAEGEEKRRGPRYTPLSKRQDRPAAILWLVKFHPELADAQIAKLVGTTKPTIASIRDRTHWNIQNIQPIDPVALGLCRQSELDAAVQKAAKKKAAEGGLMTDDERRKLLKRAIELHRYKGTPWAIRQVLETLALSGQISEWFQYGGQPYYFKINVDLSTRGIDEATFDALVALITEYKNVRSHLELLSLSLVNRSPVPSIAAATLGGEVATVYPYQLTDLNQNSALQLGIAHWSVETVTVYPGP